MIRKIKTTYTLTKVDKKYFKNQCEFLNVTQTKVAEKLGITLIYLNYILNGKRPIGEELLKKFRDLGFHFWED